MRTHNFYGPEERSERGSGQGLYFAADGIHLITLCGEAIE
jgi:hypothetical protein